MLRKIIRIDEEKCDGCGLCVTACHEGAIVLRNGKAVLLRDDYCDGLGDCLPVCPTGAITFENREALAYNEAEVLKNREKIEAESLPCGCPSSEAKVIERKSPEPLADALSQLTVTEVPSQLSTWPIQIKLVPPNAPYLDNADLLIAADCAAYVYGNFHNDFMKDKTVLIGCPKLDSEDYSEKLAAILKTNDIKSVSVVRIELPCCSIVSAVLTALKNCGKTIPWHAATISTDGRLLGQI